MHEPLKNRTYLGKKKFNFLGADFLTLKAVTNVKKQPVLGLGYTVLGVLKEIILTTPEKYCM